MDEDLYTLILPEGGPVLMAVPLLHPSDVPDGTIAVNIMDHTDAWRMSCAVSGIPSWQPLGLRPLCQ